MCASAAREAEVERLGDEIAELAAHIHAATYRLLVRLREFDRLERWSGGFRSCAHWLSWRTSLNLGAAREKVRVARALEQSPQLSEAMRTGALSYAKARAVTRVANAENEQALLELTRNATAAQVERVVRAWRRVDRQEEAWTDRERHRARHLSLYVDDDGSYVIRGRLDALLTSLAVEMKGGCAIQEDVSVAQADDLGNACAAVVQRGEQDGIALTAPCLAVGGIEHRLNLLAREEAEDRPVEALGGNSEYAPRHRQGGRAA